jgi:hypothetical protein
MDSYLIKKDIIEYPIEYFNLQNKSLNDRLNSIKLSKEDKEKIIKKHSIDTIKEKALGFFKIGELINVFISWNENIDKDIKEAKKEYLLLEYFNKNEKNEYAIQQLKSFLTNPAGNTLFNKILRILDNIPPDKELSKHLSNALNYIIQSNFQELFEQHKYALSQIEHLTPQALTILSDYKNYPIIHLGSYSANGGKITSDWLTDFTNAYVSDKGIDDKKIINRVKNSINELIAKRFIEAHLFEENQAKCIVKDLGRELLPYITQ